LLGVAAREVLYLATTLAGVLVCPAYLLLDLTTVWTEDGGATTAAKVFRAAVYVLTPHNYVAVCLAAALSDRGRQRPRHRKKMAAFGCAACCCAVPVLGVWLLTTWQGGQTLCNECGDGSAAVVECGESLLLQAAATAWWPLLLGLFLLAVVRRRGAHPAAGVAVERIETPGVLARIFHGLAAVQVAADFCSCFALGKLLEQATIGSAAFKTGALCWGYGITAFGFLLVRNLSSRLHTRPLS
jgi:hypothetical protein